MLQLKKKVEMQCDKIYSQPEDREKVRLTLIDTQETSKQFKAQLEANMEQLVGALQSKMKMMIELFDLVNLEISEQDFASNEINDPFAQQFMAETAAFLGMQAYHHTPRTNAMRTHTSRTHTLRTHPPHAPTPVALTPRALKPRTLMLCAPTPHTLTPHTPAPHPSPRSPSPHLCTRITHVIFT